MSFEVFEKVAFHPVIKQWFKHQFASPSPPQALGWPSIAEGKHTLILAPTGSGKTLAAFLWSIDHLFRRCTPQNSKQSIEPVTAIHTLYISPLKALNNDIHQNLKAPLKEIRQIARQRGLESPPIHVAVRTGDTPSHVRQSMLRHPPHILITTPESVYLLLTSARGRELFRGLKYIIVDEIHAVSNNKRGVHLSLSLERLMPLCQREPIRIGLSATQKPLQKIAAFLGGQKFSAGIDRPIPRPVNIIDCGQRKNLDLKVITPVSSFNELPDASVWEPVYQLLYKLIQTHQTTLVFANMRAQTEKIARRLNEIHRQVCGDSKAELALAHHGSISREARYDIETRLKIGAIPAVIATASLELGIDIGSIDLVVQLEAPQSISGALQRIGRSGHLMSATSKGRIIVLYPSDLDDAVGIARSIHRADIEETKIPENALDVLAQQIVAEIANKTWSYDALYRLVRQSYCYRNLPLSHFKNVVEMLTGRFGDSPLQALRPRMSWDKINNQLIARRGSRLVAVMNGGTIPDRGYYGVYLKDSNIKLGEMEEEFVFESRVGEAFFLGNSEWRIDSISQSRIIVTPIEAFKPKAPFWKGGNLFRDYSTSKKIGRFRQKLLDKIDQGNVGKWLTAKYFADQNTVETMVAYFQRQREHVSKIPTDRQLVAELSVNADGIPIFVLHAPFGARVNGAWAIALSSALERHYQIQVQYSFDDDGVLIRLPDEESVPPFVELFKKSPEEIEDYLITALPDTPIFSVQFRYNAARALLLPRSQPKKRVPLWLQRLRAADLIQAIQHDNEFPIIIETYRECLQDVLDLNALKKIIKDLNTGRIQLIFDQTTYPSPMATNILFKFVASYLYELDQSRQPGKQIDRHTEFFAEILEREKVPTLLTRELIDQAERRWQHLAIEYKGASAEDMYSIIEKLGPISQQELLKRAKGDSSAWLHDLQSANRIVAFTQKHGGKTITFWSVPEEVPTVAKTLDESAILQQVQRYLSSRGPVNLDQIQTDLCFPRKDIKNALLKLRQKKLVMHGPLVIETKGVQWCDRHNFMQLYRTAIAARRRIQAPANRLLFNRFLLQWHVIDKSGQSLKELIRRYRGFRFPLYFFERHILSSRFGRFARSNLNEKIEEFEHLISEGEIIAQTGRTMDNGRRYIEFRLRGEGTIFFAQETLLAKTSHLNPAATTVFDFLNECGASYFRDIELGTGLTLLELQRALRELADRRLASCENYSAFLMVLQSPHQQKTNHPSAIKNTRRGVYPQRPLPLKRSAIRELVQARAQMKDGRWFLTTSFAIMGKPISTGERATRQARLLLQRYGILVKEWYRREEGLLPWYQIFQALKRLEWQGEIRRGYFVEGLSGIQFALPEAVELLVKIQNNNKPKSNTPIMLSTIDPALPFGGSVDWGLVDSQGDAVRIVRAASNYLVFVGGMPVLYGENGFNRLLMLQNLSPATYKSSLNVIQNLLKLPQRLRPNNRIEISQINNQPAAHSQFTDHFIKIGFEKDREKLVLWPSSV
jgi:ATP-dependent Lhr-like helicase